MQLNVMDASKSFSLFKAKEGQTVVGKEHWHTKVPNILDANKMMHAEKTQKNDNDMLKQRFENQYVAGSNLNKRAMSESKTANSQHSRTQRNYYKSFNGTEQQRSPVRSNQQDLSKLFGAKAMKPKQWRTSYDTNEITGTLQHSRYAHVSKNNGQDCAATTYGRFMTHATDTHCKKSTVPDEIPIFDSSKTNKILKLSAVTSPDFLPKTKGYNEKVQAMHDHLVVIKEKDKSIVHAPMSSLQKTKNSMQDHFYKTQMSGFKTESKGKAPCLDNSNNTPWMRHQSTAQANSRPEKQLYGSPEALMRSIQTGEGRNRKYGTMQGLSENSPAIAYRNSLMEESMNKSNMIQGFNQNQKDKYQRITQLKTQNQELHHNQFEKSAIINGHFGDSLQGNNINKKYAQTISRIATEPSSPSAASPRNPYDNSKQAIKITHESAGINKHQTYKEAKMNKDMQMLEKPFALVEPPVDRRTVKPPQLTDKQVRAVQMARLHLKNKKKANTNHGPFLDQFPFNNGMDETKQKFHSHLSERKPVDEQKVTYWAGMRINGHQQPFQKKECDVQKWQAQYFNGGCFQHISNPMGHK